MIKSSMGFNSLLLGGFALIVAVVVAVIHQTTEPRIQAAKTRAAQAALYEIIPEDRIDNDLFTDTLTVPENFQTFLGLAELPDNEQQIYIARQSGQPVAAIIPGVAPEGYGGAIKMLVGVNADGSIAGVRVTDHRETPGLGDYVEVRKGTWILSFNEQSLSPVSDEESLPDNAALDDLALQGGLEGDFDQLTGATITRTAVTRQVKKTLAFFNIAKPLQDKP